MRKFFRYLMFTVSSFGLTLMSDCTYEDIGANCSTFVSDPSYSLDILPILQAKCNFAGCHPDNGNWFEYATAASKASEIKYRTTNRIMPKGGVNAPGGALSIEQITIIACWANSGAKN